MERKTTLKMSVHKALDRPCLEEGKRIKMIRLKRGMSMQELADAVGYKQRTSIWAIEDGQADLTIGQLKSLAAALGTDPLYLMGFTNDPTPYETEPNPLDELELTETERMQVENFAKYLHDSRSTS